jgi:hypothetical protein
MIKYILVLLVFPFTCYAQDTKYNCTERYHYSLKERLSHYPFNIATNVMLVSFNENYHGLPIKHDTVCILKLKEKKLLNSVQVDSLTSILYNIGQKGNVFKLTMASCYEPRNAILFINAKGKAVQFIEICFACGRTKESDEKIDNGITCNQKLELIRSFFIKQGIKYGAAHL